jgi:hypothetical protein
MIHHEETCELHCTDNDKTVTADVSHFRLHDGLTVYLLGNKIVLKYNNRHDIYVGNLMGKEFTTKGPKYYETKQGRR